MSVSAGSTPSASDRSLRRRLKKPVPTTLKTVCGFSVAAIARAFMSDAQILILDEPTAAVDAFREHRLYEQFAQMAKNKTAVFISHRCSTVRMADLIVVIDDGRVIETGSHDELMAQDGKYAAMFSTQAARYR